MDPGIATTQPRLSRRAAKTIQGIGDRLDAIGGSLRVESTVGAGTTLGGSIPTEPRR